MRITTGDLEITKNVLTGLFKKYSQKFDYEVKSGTYENDYTCPSYTKVQSLADALVCMDESRE